MVDAGSGIQRVWEMIDRMHPWDDESVASVRKGMDPFPPCAIAEAKQILKPLARLRTQGAAPKAWSKHIDSIGSVHRAVTGQTPEG